MTTQVTIRNDGPDYILVKTSTLIGTEPVYGNFHHLAPKQEMAFNVYEGQTLVIEEVKVQAGT